MTPEQTEQAAKAFRERITSCPCSSCIAMANEQFELLQSELAKVGLAIQPIKSKSVIKHAWYCPSCGTQVKEPEHVGTLHECPNCQSFLLKANSTD